MSKLHIIFVLTFSLIMLKGNGLRLVPAITVYLHAILSGPDATAYEVGRASISSTSPTKFGIVRAADDFLTAQPDPNSEMMGRAQGLIIRTGLNEPAITVELTFTFTSGPYNGSSITIAGRKLLTGQNQEIPIIGGTGDLRYLIGYTLSNLFSFNNVTSTYVSKYVFHPIKLLGKGTILGT